MRTPPQPMPQLPLEYKKKFLSNVEKNDDPNACWGWKGKVNGDGYGAFSYKSKIYIASRISYFLHYGEDPKGLLVCHSCDNKFCQNPSHFFLGTDLDNNLDKISKGRGNFAKGEATNKAKLSTDTVIEVRERYKQGCNYEMLGKEYNVDPTTIKRAVKGIRWSHIPDAVDDKVERGIVVNPYTKYSKGSDHGHAKLTETIVLQIRAEYAAGARVCELTQKYGVVQSAISRVIKRQRWAHI